MPEPPMTPEEALDTILREAEQAGVEHFLDAEKRAVVLGAMERTPGTVHFFLISARERIAKAKALKIARPPA